jgi:hypothetical protein
MKYLKLDLLKMNNAEISECGNWLQVPIPSVGTGEKGIFHGKKGLYVDAVLWENDEQDEYGNSGSVQISLSKEEREAGEKGAYIGNLKIVE